MSPEIAFDVLRDYRRTFQPGAEAVEIAAGNNGSTKVKTLEPLHPAGVFGAEVKDLGAYRLRTPARA